MSLLDALKNAFLNRCKMDHVTWETVKGLFSSRVMASNEYFAVEGEPASNFAFVSSGYLRMVNLTRDGHDLTKHFFVPQHFVVSAIRPGTQNTCSIQALTECRLFVAGFEELENLSERNLHIHEFKMNLIDEFVRMKQQRENNYLSMDARARYELFLENYPLLIDNIAHYHIASYLGVTPTQLSRVRKKMKKTTG